MNDELARAAVALRLARGDVSAAMLGAQNAARNAHDVGMSEVQIAKCLGVTRDTVRAWLGKSRRR